MWQLVRSVSGINASFVNLLGSKRNLNSADRAVGWERQFHGTAKFMRNEIADEAGAIA